MHIELPEHVSIIIRELQSHGHEAYAVGGCVRDSLMGRIPKDWDITTSAAPNEVKGIFRHTIDTGIRHGTVTVRMENTGYEVTTYRIDGAYKDSRHPESVEFTRSLSEDLRRRDFTVNAIAYNDSGGLIDLFDGMKDLEKKIIRCVGDPYERFGEDALRILRAIRFSAQLDFSIDEETLAAAGRLAPTLRNVSAERIRDELGKLLSSDHPGHILVAYNAGITRILLPEFDAMMATPQENHSHMYSVGEHSVKAVECIPSCPEFLRWTMLLHDVGKSFARATDSRGIPDFHDHSANGAVLAVKILRRLRFDNKTTELVRRLIAYHDTPLYDLSDRELRHIVSKAGDDIMGLLFMVNRADIAAKNPEGYEIYAEKLDYTILQYNRIKARGDCLSVRELKINGSDLIELGIPAGRQVGEALNRLLELVLDTPSLNDHELLLREAFSLCHAITTEP